MREPYKRPSKSGQYIVRLYDYLDGWLSVSKQGTWEECLEYWNTKTNHGTHMATQSSRNDYWDIFPAGTCMLDTPAHRGR